MVVTMSKEKSNTRNVKRNTIKNDKSAPVEEALRRYERRKGKKSVATTTKPKPKSKLEPKPKPKSKTNRSVTSRGSRSNTGKSRITSTKSTSTTSYKKPAAQNKNTVQKKKVPNSKVTRDNSTRRSTKTKRIKSKPPLRKTKSKARAISILEILYSSKFPRVLRLLFFSLIISFFIYQYYQASDGEMSGNYMYFWGNQLEAMIPAVLFIVFIGFALYIGYQVGKKE